MASNHTGILMYVALIRADGICEEGTDSMEKFTFVFGNQTLKLHHPN